MTNFIMPNNVSFMNYALKSGPGLADVGILHEDLQFEVIKNNPHI